MSKTMDAPVSVQQPPVAKPPVNNIIPQSPVVAPVPANNPQSPPIPSQATPEFLKTLKSAMVMGPTPKLEGPTSGVSKPGTTETTSTSLTSTSTTTTAAAPILTTTTTSSTSSISTPNATSAGATIKAASSTSSSIPVVKEKEEKVSGTETCNSASMELRNQIILNPLKQTVVSSSTVPTTIATSTATATTLSSSSPTKSSTGPTIGNLIKEMESVREDAINSINQMSFPYSSATKAKASEASNLGKDVSTAIGRIDQVRGLTSSSASPLPSTGPTATPRSKNVAGKGSSQGSSATTNTTSTVVGDNNNRPEPSPRTRTAHDFGASVEATPKTQTQRIRARTTTATSTRAASASAANTPSHRVGTTVSAKALTNTNSNNITSTYKRSERPATSFTRSTASSAFKGVSNNSPSTTLRSNRSYSAIRTHQKMGDAAGDAPAAPASTEKPTLKDQFAAFSRFGDTSSDGKSISLSNSDKWLKQAKIIDGKKITTTDTSISFKKLFKTAKKVNFEDFKKYIEDLASSKKLEVSELHEKLTNCGLPGLSSATKAAHVGVIERLTDTSKYTGSHKERFDASGKGKGIEGRRDVKDGSGYVSGFKAKQLSSEKNGSTSPVPK